MRRERGADVAEESGRDREELRERDPDRHRDRDRCLCKLSESQQV